MNKWKDLFIIATIVAIGEAFLSLEAFLLLKGNLGTTHNNSYISYPQTQPIMVNFSIGKYHLVYDYFSNFGFFYRVPYWTENNSTNSFSQKSYYYEPLPFQVAYNNGTLTAFVWTYSNFPANSNETIYLMIANKTTSNISNAIESVT